MNIVPDIIKRIVVRPPYAGTLHEIGEALLNTLPQPASYALESIKENRRRVQESSTPEQTLKETIPTTLAAIATLYQDTGVNEEGTQKHITPTKAQYLTALSLLDGKIAELATGEGKTYAIPLAAIPLALRGRTSKNTSSVHIMTANEYLAERDAQRVRPIYDSLGLEAKVLPQRKNYPSTPQGEQDYTAALNDALTADITLGTLQQFGFARLGEEFSAGDRKMILPEGEQTLRAALIDEADYLLLDNATIGLRLSAPIDPAAAGALKTTLEQAITLASKLTRGKAILDKRGKAASITGDYIIWNTTRHSQPVIDIQESGIRKIEAALHTWNATAPENTPTLHIIQQALRAGYLAKDKDYIVTGGNVVLVDQATGRPDPTRRLNGLLHALLEAREGCTIHPEPPLLNTTSVRSFLEENYGHIAGTTGTASEDITREYGLKTIVIPSTHPSRRTDVDVPAYRTLEEKNGAIAKNVVRLHGKKRAVLIETQSVQEAEHLEQLINGEARKTKTTTCTPIILTAKNDDEEARIIAEAGREGAVTVSTNIASRGTHIEAPNLHVATTAHYPSRRADRQAGGRTGRQGKPGTWWKYHSLEDEYPTREAQESREANDGVTRKYTALFASMLEATRKQFLQHYDDVVSSDVNELGILLTTALITTTLDNAQQAMTKTIDDVLEELSQGGVELPARRTLTEHVAEATIKELLPTLEIITPHIEKRKQYLHKTLTRGELSTPPYNAITKETCIEEQELREAYTKALLATLEKACDDVTLPTTHQLRTLLTEDVPRITLLTQEEREQEALMRELINLGTTPEEASALINQARERCPSHATRGLQELMTNIFGQEWKTFQAIPNFETYAKTTTLEHIKKGWTAHIAEAEEQVSALGTTSAGRSETEALNSFFEESTTTAQECTGEALVNACKEIYTGATTLLTSTTP